MESDNMKKIEMDKKSMIALEKAKKKLTQMLIKKFGESFIFDREFIITIEKEYSTIEYKVLSGLVDDIQLKHLYMSKFTFVMLLPMTSQLQ